MLLLLITFAIHLFRPLGSTHDELLRTVFSPTAVILQVLFTSLVLTVIAFGVPRTFRVSSSRWLGLGSARPSVFAISIIGVVGAGFIVDQAIFFLHWLAPEIFDTRGLQMFSRIFASASPAAFAAMTVAVVIGPGIGEELFFRGLVLRSFRVDMPAWLAVIFSSFLFGLLHMNAMQGTGAGMIGLFLGFLVLRTGSVWPSVAAHGVNNLVSAFFSRYDLAGAGYAWSHGHPVWVLLSAAAVTAASIAILLKLTKAEKKE